VETEEQTKIYAPRTKEEYNKRWGPRISLDLMEEEDCTTEPVKL